MTHTCRSCGAGLRVSSPAALQRGTCPRCGVPLSAAPAAPAAPLEPATVPARRLLFALGAFTVALLLPLGLCLALLLGGGSGTKDDRPANSGGAKGDDRVARADELKTTPGSPETSKEPSSKDSALVE